MKNLMMSLVALLPLLGVTVLAAGMDVEANSARMRYNTVKIDGSFIRGLTTDRSNLVFLRHLLGLAGDLGLATVAESVENETQVAILRDEGAGFLQGHYFGPPSTDRPWTSQVPV